MHTRLGKRPEFKLRQSPDDATFGVWRSFYEVKVMQEIPSPMAPREQKIVDLLLQGCDNSEIARDLNIAERTVKAHFNRLFVRFGIKGGIKRVKLATLLYRRQLWQERQQELSEAPANENTSSFNA
jgi:DNA-binding NarL/FixJ family response regulator